MQSVGSVWRSGRDGGQCSRCSDICSFFSFQTGVRQDVKKRIEDIRLLESRKSARLADQDTDFAKLADMSTDRKERKPSQTIDVPAPTTGFQG